MPRERWPGLYRSQHLGERLPRVTISLFIDVPHHNAPPRPPLSDRVKNQRAVALTLRRIKTQVDVHHHNVLQIHPRKTTPRRPRQTLTQLRHPAPQIPRQNTGTGSAHPRAKTITHQQRSSHPTKGKPTWHHALHTQRIGQGTHPPRSTQRARGLLNRQHIGVE